MALASDGELTNEMVKMTANDKIVHKYFTQSMFANFIQWYSRFFIQLNTAFLKTSSTEIFMTTVRCEFCGKL